MKSHEQYMHLAIEEAKRAAEMGEVPIGAVAVAGDNVVGTAHNIREATANPLGHAELLLIEKLTDFPSPLWAFPLPLGEGVRGRGKAPSPLGERVGVRGSWRFEDVTIYVTCEPCIMCMGALLQARVPKLVFGCFDPKAGACGSLYNLAADTRLNHRIEVVSGVLEEKCSKLLKDFFVKLRK